MAGVRDGERRSGYCRERSSKSAKASAPMNNCAVTKPHTVESSIILKYILVTLKIKNNVKKMYLIFKVITGICWNHLAFCKI